MRNFTLDEEIRNDFLVTTKRKKIWNIQLEMVKEIQRICKKYKIRYFIIWGTLLGAVRHEGFIPWDDDFDIGMLRPDYERFCEAAEKEIKSPYFFQTALTDREFFIGYARVRDSRTTGIVDEHFSYNYNNGIFIDIYPFDAVPDSKIGEKIQFYMIEKIADLAVHYHHPEKAATWKRLIYKIVDYEKLVQWHKQCCIVGNKKRKVQRIGLMYRPQEIRDNYWFYIKDVSSTIKLPFENLLLPVPKGYDSLLKQVYGDYMKFPPKAKRGAWHKGQIIYEPDVPYQEFIKQGMRRSKDV